MKLNELTNKSPTMDPELAFTRNFASTHYPDMPDPESAFEKFIQRSLDHARADDDNQDVEINDVEKRLSAVEKELARLKVLSGQQGTNYENY